MKRLLFFSLVVVMVFNTFASSASVNNYPGSPYKWPKGPSANPAHFPIGVWLQSPSNAAKYKAAGINMYVGLWQGPTEAQLAELTAAGMPVICYQNEVGLAHVDDPIIIGWSQQDEPDNAQSDGKGGYDPPVLPEVIVERYNEMRANDYTRPIFLNLGQGVANTNYIGRGTRRGHMDDYPEYIKGADIISFDIYPVASPYEEIQGNIEYVANGVDSLVEWSDGAKPVWNFIECTHISSTKKASPAQVKAEVWSSIIHGSKGIMYFVHQFQPTFNEDALLDDSEMLEAVTAINAQITELAPLISSDDKSSHWYPKTGKIDIMAKMDYREDHLGDMYIFAVNKYDRTETLTITDRGKSRDSRNWEVLGEDRVVGDFSGFSDEFGPYEVRIYRQEDAINVSVEDETPDTSLTLHGNSPNPFNPSTTISFTLADESHGAVKVYDITGQSVRTLFDGEFHVGMSTLSWDGLDTQGNPSSSGIYFYEVAAGGLRKTGRMLLLR